MPRSIPTYKRSLIFFTVRMADMLARVPPPFKVHLGNGRGDPDRFGALLSVFTRFHFEGQTEHRNQFL